MGVKTSAGGLHSLIAPMDFYHCWFLSGQRGEAPSAAAGESLNELIIQTHKLISILTASRDN